MKKALGPEATALRLWRQLYQTYTLVKQTEDMIFEEHGLTTEQYAVLVSISYLGEPARITDIARWLERSTNSISMIVDRMVKAGLVRRTRDKRDRRVVYVSKTSKAESLFAPATVASFEAVRKILSPMPYKDRLVLLDLLADVKYETLKYLTPGVDIGKTKREELRQAANIDQWLSRYAGLSTPERKRKGSASGKGRKSTR
jgi:DNA-binding MarR family transcriptional regulator